MLSDVAAKAHVLNQSRPHSCRGSNKVAGALFEGVLMTRLLPGK